MSDKEDLNEGKKIIEESYSKINDFTNKLILSGFYDTEEGKSLIKQRYKESAKSTMDSINYFLSNKHKMKPLDPDIAEEVNKNFDELLMTNQVYLGEGKGWIIQTEENKDYIGSLLELNKELK